MTTTTVRLIHYGNHMRNSVGLNVMSGRLTESNPRQRELWATWVGTMAGERRREFGASYGGTWIEHNGSALDTLRDMIGETNEAPEEPDDILIQHCPGCGTDDDYHARTCAFGGE